jgi:hypothetical protein
VTGESPSDRAAVERAIAESVSDEPAVIAAYLFGSVARGTAGPLSDVDLGLLLRSGSGDSAICARVMDRMCRRLGPSRIDVVSLTDAPLPLRYQVVRDGAVVLCRDAAALERFVADSILQYLDFKPLRDRAFAVMRAAILEKK